AGREAGRTGRIAPGDLPRGGAGGDTDLPARRPRARTGDRRAGDHRPGRHHHTDLSGRQGSDRSLGQYRDRSRTGDPLMALNPIEVEIMRNALASICDEMYVAIMRSAYSTNIK